MGATSRVSRAPYSRDGRDVAIWYIGQCYLAVAYGAFSVGRHVRDFQWYSVMAKEWCYTVRFIDWDKVRRIAAGESAYFAEPGNGEALQ